MVSTSARRVPDVVGFVDRKDWCSFVVIQIPHDSGLSPIPKTGKKFLHLQGDEAATHLAITTVWDTILIKLTPWLMEPGGSVPPSQGLSNNPYPEPNQPNYPH